MKNIFFRITSVFICFSLLFTHTSSLAHPLDNSCDSLITLFEKVNFVNYDLNDDGSISVVKEGNTKKIWYFYDKQNQLIREDNSILGESIAYIYDVEGNIESKKIYNFSNESLNIEHLKSTIIYNYDESGKMLCYNNEKISYDEFGNPLNYREGWSFTWENNKLVKTSKPGINIKYVYDENGNRIKKITNGVTTVFDFMNNSNQKSDKNILHWYFPEENELKSFNYNGKDYTYFYNLQGDIIGIFDEQNNIVAKYTYDTWGKLISIVDQNGNDVTNDVTHIGYINPLRYRGYYYDSETKLYYLNSRYYDPETGRFLSKDDEQYSKNNDTDICNINLYSYCLNNPVNMVDYDGHDSYALSVFLLKPELAPFALAVSVAMAAMLLTNPMIKGVVDKAISWAIQSCVDSASAIYAKFRELGQVLSSKISDLVKAYNIFIIKQKIPSSLKISDDRVDLSKFTEPGQMNNKGPRGKKGPNGWTIVKVVGVAHKDDLWKLFDKAGRRVASLLADGTIIGK